MQAPAAFSRSGWQCRSPPGQLARCQRDHAACLAPSNNSTGLRSTYGEACCSSGSRQHRIQSISASQYGGRQCAWFHCFSNQASARSTLGQVLRWFPAVRIQSSASQSHTEKLSFLRHACSFPRGVKTRTITHLNCARICARSSVSGKCQKSASFSCFVFICQAILCAGTALLCVCVPLVRPVSTRSQPDRWRSPAGRTRHGPNVEALPDGLTAKRPYSMATGSRSVRARLFRQLRWVGRPARIADPSYRARSAVCASAPGRVVPHS